MDNENLIEFAKGQCEIFPEDSEMGMYLRETLKILQAKPCEDAISRQAVLAIIGDSCLDLDEYEDTEAFCYEINSLPPVKPVACIANVNFSKEDMQEIVDNKVKEIEMEKHTDRQIYDGCIHLMQKMVDYFQEYLDYLGYNFDEQDKDERFAIEMLNMEIIRWLFLFHTRNSGGCSTKDFCEKLGVDPYKSVKFEFEESEEHI